MGKKDESRQAYQYQHKTNMKWGYLVRKNLNLTETMVPFLRRIESEVKCVKII